MLQAVLTSPRKAALLLGAVATAALIFALVMQYHFGLAPCVLCIYQRVPYALVVAVALAVAVTRDRFAVPALFGMGTLFMIGAGIAVFHTGVEQQWWEGTASCGVPRLDASDLETLRQQIMNMPAARCDQIAWVFLGLSMATWNVALSGALAVAAFYAGRKNLPPKKPAASDQKEA